MQPQTKHRLRQLPLLALALASLSACSTSSQQPAPSDRLLSFVDPFIGTGEHGHTFPGATRPNAMVQFSPDTHLIGWDASSGYHATDSTIYAFSLTHLSGTGVGDLGDVAVLPYSGVDSLKPVARFAKKDEKASPGYYAVELANFGIRTELTSTERVGLMRATYSDSTDRKLLLDLGHILQPNWGHKVVGNDLELVNDSTIRGTYYTKGWAEHHQLSYTLHLSRPVDSLTLWRNGQRSRIEAGYSTSLGTKDSVASLICVSACRMLISRPVTRITSRIGDAVVISVSRAWRPMVSTVSGVMSQSSLPGSPPAGSSRQPARTVPA